MSMMVHKDEAIENALKRLYAEVVRENIFEVVNKKRYFVKPSEDRCVKRREWKKRKRRRRSAKRKSRNKGIE